jgi:hypothetical protein
VAVRVRVAALDAVTGAPWRDGPQDALRVPPETRLAGVVAAGGVRPFATGLLPERLLLVAWLPEPEAVTIDLVAAGREHPPLDPGDAYGGELLP